MQLYHFLFLLKHIGLFFVYPFAIITATFGFAVLRLSCHNYSKTFEVMSLDISDSS